VADRRVVIVGGGPAGTAAAIVLARHRLAVTLVESASRRYVHGGEALPPAIAPLLAEIGVLDEIARAPHLRCDGNESAWGASTLRLQSFMTNAYGRGWHIDRHAFDTTLRGAAQRAGAQLDDDAREREHEAAFVVDASGRDAVVAHARGSRRTHVDHLIAVIGVLRGSSADGPATSLIEAVEHGYWYSAPLPFDRRMCVYFTDPDLWHHSPPAALDAWCASLDETTHTATRAAGYERPAAVRIVAAGTSWLGTLHGASWLAVGDAAACRDPLSSGGIYEAIRSGIRGANAIVRSFAGEPQAVDAYAADIETRFARDLTRRRTIYQQEPRWADSPFWMMRRSRRDGDSTRLSEDRADSRLQPRRARPDGVAAQALRARLHA